MKLRYLLVAVGTLLWLSCPVLAAPNIATVEEVNRTTAEVQDVAVSGNTIYGKVVNKSSLPLKDIRLLVRHIWLWNNEYDPGQDNYSTAEFVTLEGIIMPGESKDFSLISSLPALPGGRFETKIIIGEFTQLPHRSALR